MDTSRSWKDPGHRLRLDGELTELRAADLRFSLPEAQELFAAAGTGLSEAAVALLHERTEGWAAGLRLAALSLATHPDPERFAAEFSGTERTVAEYLLAEVLDRQSDQVRRLLLHTSILERVNGDLADLLTGDDGGERILQDLERANAFVVSLDTPRTWFRYHQMFASLLRLELRRTTQAQAHVVAGGQYEPQLRRRPQHQQLQLAQYIWAELVQVVDHQPEGGPQRCQVRQQPLHDRPPIQTGGGRHSLHQR